MQGPDPALLKELVTMKMPFGKYKDRILCDLPEDYILWFRTRGFPKGRNEDVVCENMMQFQLACSAVAVKASSGICHFGRNIAAGARGSVNESIHVPVFQPFICFYCNYFIPGIIEMHLIVFRYPESADLIAV